MCKLIDYYIFGRKMGLRPLEAFLAAIGCSIL